MSPESKKTISRKRAKAISDHNYYVENKAARNAYKNAWYQANRERILFQAKEYRRENQEALKARDRERYPRERAARLRSAKQFRVKNSAYIKEYSVQYRKGTRNKWNQYRAMARSKGRVFTLSYEQLCALVSQPCSYCGKLKEINGIDRVDNMRGYVLDNVVPCCTTCNTMKMGLSLPEFVTHVLLIAKRFERHSVKLLEKEKSRGGP